MLSILGLLGGKAIGKYIAIGLSAVALVSFIYFGWVSYDKAIERAAQTKIQLEQANTETEAANENVKVVADILENERVQSNRKYQRLQALSRKRSRRANETSAQLALIFNAMGGDAAVADYQRLLLRQLERGQGEPFNSTDKAGDTTTSPPGLPIAGVPFACFDKRTAEIMLSNATENADYIEDVQALKTNSVPDKSKENDSKP